MNSNLFDLEQLMSGSGSLSAVERQQRDALNRLYQAPVWNIVKSPLNECLDYFRKLGLTDEQIRKAITPALFKALA